MTSIRSIGSGLGARLTYANVMSTLAFVIAFGGGTAYATHLVVESSDIVDGQVMTADLANSAVTGSKVASGSLFGSDIADGSLFSNDIGDNSLTGGDIAANTLTGSDVAESSLATVPSATKAANVNGVTIVPIEYLEGSNAPERTVFSKSGLTLTAKCSSSGDLDVRAHTDRNARFLTWSVDSETGGTNNEIDDESFVSPYEWSLVGEDDGDQSGQTSYMTSSGNVVIVTWAADNNTSGAFGVQCAFVGQAAIH